MRPRVNGTNTDIPFRIAFFLISPIFFPYFSKELETVPPFVSRVAFFNFSSRNHFVIERVQFDRVNKVLIKIRFNKFIVLFCPTLKYSDAPLFVT